MSTDDLDDVASENRVWSRRAQDIGAVVWPSFLAACLGTFIFFGVFDPALLGDDANPPKWLADRMTGYAAGFFFFWLVAIAASAMTAFLLESKPRSVSRDE
jgi:hypothetical protein